MRLLLEAQNRYLRENPEAGRPRCGRGRLK